MIETMAMLLSTIPSLALKVKLSEPLKPATGVYVKFGVVPDKAPCAGLPITE